MMLSKKEKYKTLALFPVVLVIAIFEPIWEELVKFWARSEMWPKYKENFKHIWQIYTHDVWQ